VYKSRKDKKRKEKES